MSDVRWIANESSTKLRGYILSVLYERESSAHVWNWYIRSEAPGVKGAASGTSKSYELAVAAAEEVALCLAKHSP